METPGAEGWRFASFSRADRVVGDSTRNQRALAHGAQNDHRHLVPKPDRLRATAQAEGVSVDAYVERLMNEREEIAAIVESTSAKHAQSGEETRAKIERGFSESETGDVVDGEEFAGGLLSELDEMERKQRAG